MMKLKSRKSFLALERGSIIVLFAIVISAIVAGVALSIDLFIFSSQRAKYDRTAEQAALAALEGYLTTLSDTTKTPNQALDQALLRAQQSVNENLTGFFGTSLAGADPDDLDELQAGTWGTAGRILPGLWHFTDSPEAANCDTPSTPFEPCFQTVTAADRANAIQVELRVPSSGILKVFFPVLVPEQHRTFTASSVASLLPRRAVFLVDLSSSIVRDTHRIGGGTRAEYAYYLDPDQNTDCSAGWSGDIHPAFQSIYDNMPAGPRPSGAVNPVMHYRDEYQCQEITSEGEAFAIDNVVAPEPLTGVLNAIHEALTAFENRAVSADRVGVAGFDDEILAVRKLDMAKPVSSDADFQSFLDATDTSLPISARKEKFLFPRFLGSRTVSYVDGSGNTVVDNLPAMTDISRALEEAKNMLVNISGFEVSDNFVVLISDGLGNCADNPPAGGGGQRCRYTSSDLALSQSYIEQSVNEVIADSQEYASLGIRLHTFLIGEEVAPHMLVRKAPSGCMTDEDARIVETGALSMVNHSGGTFDPSDSAPYYFPNKLYQVAQATRGLWVPVVDCCRNAGGSCASDGMAQLDSFCDSSGGAVGDPVPCTCSGAGCPVACGGWVDANARMVCDPEGRTKEQQVIDAVDWIMENNPFILVK